VIHNDTRSTDCYVIVIHNDTRSTECYVIVIHNDTRLTECYVIVIHNDTRSTECYVIVIHNDTRSTKCQMQGLLIHNKLNTQIASCWSYYIEKRFCRPIKVYINKNARFDITRAVLPNFVSDETPCHWTNSCRYLEEPRYSRPTLS
jgi:hypothetical protein